jgi:hypothetical protein
MAAGAPWIMGHEMVIGNELAWVQGGGVAWMGGVARLADGWGRWKNWANKAQQLGKIVSFEKGRA